MPVKPNAAVRAPFFGACRYHNNIEIGEYVAQYVAEPLFELDPQNSGHYIILSNNYAASGRWDDVKFVKIDERQEDHESTRLQLD